MWWVTLPAFISSIELCSDNMSGNTGHDDFARAPSSMIERVIEFIVFVVCSARHISLLNTVTIVSFAFFGWHLSRSEHSCLNDSLRLLQLRASLQHTKWCSGVAA